MTQPLGDFKTDKEDAARAAYLAANPPPPEPKKKEKGEQTIVLVRADNPKRPGSAAHARYELYRTCSTVDEFLAKGGQSIDLTHDAKKGFIKLE